MTRASSDALLIRPDAYVAWAATIDEPSDTAVPALRDSLSGWFGTPLKPIDSIEAFSSATG